MDIHDKETVMGYYVTYDGEVSFPTHREGEIVEALKALNHRHDLKTGGRHPKTGDPYEDYWFSWLPSRYHEDERLDNVQSILELLGFDCFDYETAAEGWTTYSVTYDNKIGSEEIFLNELSRFGTVDIYATGEDGDRWRYLTKDGDLLQYNGYVSYDDLRPISTNKLLEERAERAKLTLDNASSV
jgi:hypothetical protein